MNQTPIEIIDLKILECIDFDSFSSNIPNSFFGRIYIEILILFDGHC